jgi:RNA polymerase sigma-70 factor (ECF subfamily)
MEKLGERLARGEQAAFAELYDACADRLHHYLTLRLGTREDADDVLQNSFVRLAQARHRLAGVKNLIETKGPRIGIPQRAWL